MPMSAEAAASASAEPVPEILLRMLGTAPPALAERAVALLRALQRQTRLVEARCWLLAAFLLLNRGAATQDSSIAAAKQQRPRAF